EVDEGSTLGPFHLVLDLGSADGRVADRARPPAAVARPRVTVHGEQRATAEARANGSPKAILVARGAGDRERPVQPAPAGRDPIARFSQEPLVLLHARLRTSDLAQGGVDDRGIGEHSWLPSLPNREAQMLAYPRGLCKVHRTGADVSAAHAGDRMAQASGACARASRPLIWRSVEGCSIPAAERGPGVVRALKELEGRFVRGRRRA